MRLTISITPVCIAAVPLRVAEALAAFALQGAFLGVVRFHRDTQTAEFSQGTHFRHFRSPRHRHNKVRG